MRKPAKRALRPARPPRVRNSHGRQRQRLIDACISALHIYGPSQTTVEKVVAIAKMSPGIVRFYFASKAAMMVASLQFLSSEFEEQLLVPVTRLKSRPVAALELMVDLYLDPEIASPRKVSVWYAFWGEASSRQEYYDICGQKDESFASLVRELIERLIAESGLTQLDADGVALGLIGVLEMLWQDFAFRSESEIDRPAAKRRAMAYLRSVFPGYFTAPGEPHALAMADRAPAPWVYQNARIFAAEREAVFHQSWQLAGHAARIPAPGDFLGVDLRFERVLVLRDPAGAVRAFRNSCTEAPHVLVSARAGRMQIIRCALHGMEYDLGGATLRGGADLAALEVRVIDGLILIRAGARNAARGADVPQTADWESLMLAPDLKPLGGAEDVPVSADWKIVVELWLQHPAPARAGSASWSARSYLALLRNPAAGPAGAERGLGDIEYRFVAPNTLVQIRPDGVTVEQVLPVAPGKCLLRRHRYTRWADARAARAAAFLGARLDRCGGGAAGAALAESIQEGLVNFNHVAHAHGPRSAALSEFRRRLAALVPALNLTHPLY